jgi:hypothetical protein
LIMAKLKPDAELALHKLGQRIREGHAKKHPTSDKSLETVKDAVRKQYEQEQDAKRNPSVEPPNPTPEREPHEPEP